MLIIRGKNDTLCHYGTKGMKWGVRRFDKKNGDLVLKKGTTVKRITTSSTDPIYDNKKYVSVNQKDHNKWSKYIGGSYAKRGKGTFDVSYITNKDLKIMSVKKQGKLYIDMMRDETFKSLAIKDTEYATKSLGLKPSKKPAVNISRNIAMQTDTAKKFISKLLYDKYDALEDTHGKNVSKKPLIILNPDKNISRSDNGRTTNITKEYTDVINKTYKMPKGTEWVYDRKYGIVKKK